MKKIVINNDNRRFNISSIVVGYLEENKEEVLEFKIPEKYAEYGKKACFSANGQTFAKNFDDVISNKLTITRDISQFKELDMTIEFFKIENEDKIVARTSILHILIENAIICDDDIKPDEPKIIILDNLIDEVTKLDVLVTKNEEKREKYYQEIQEKVDNGDFNGATFTPSVDTDGNISWSNDKNLSNPTTQNIKGPKGPKGDTYNLTEQDKQDISKITVESSESAFNQYYNGKLEDFNTNATNKTNEFNTNADNKIAEYDLHSQELDNKIVSTRNELERVKNDILETGTDTDTYIHVEDSAMAEYQELSVDGVCEQVTTSGKNLLPRTTKTTQTVNGITFTINEDGTIKAKGTASNRATLFLGNNTTLPSGTYATSSGLNGASGVRFGLEAGSNYLNTNTNRTDKFSEETIIKNSYFQIDSGVTVNNLVLKPMVRLASITDDTYEPYTGGQPSPSPDYPQPISTIENSLKITSCNKNLFDTTKIASGTSQGISYSVDNNGIIILNGTTNGYPIEIPLNTNISLNGTYTYIPKISDITKINNIALKDASYNNVVLSSIPTTSNISGIVTKICLYVSSEVVFNNDTLSIQILKGTQSTATSYEQHLETQITANLPENEFIGKINDTLKDTLKVEYNETDGQYHLKLYKRVYKNNSYNGESYNYYISTTARKDGNIECGELQTGQVVYYVGDETIIDLGIVEMPITYNEITNLFTDSDLLPQINAKYYRNFILTVRNLQVNEKALNQELIDINNRLSALETAQANVVSESEVVE